MEIDDRKILNKQYVLEHGTDFDEKLWFTSYSDLVLDNPEDKNGKPFSGLVYELDKNGNIVYYCYYLNGLAEGQNVEFYESGKLLSKQIMVRGQTRGIRQIWYESGETKYKGEFKYGICLWFKEWDRQGNIIKQKLEPSKGDLRLIEKFTRWDING